MEPRLVASALPPAAGLYAQSVKRCRIGKPRHVTTTEVASVSRRELGAAAGVLAGLRLCGDNASAAESVLCDERASYACMDSSEPGYRVLETLRYSFELPESYVKVVDTGDKADALVLRFTSPDGSQAISLVCRTASVERPTFFQVSDISQYGNVEKVAGFFLPKTALIIASESQSFPQPSFDTGTPRGIVEKEDVTIYRYIFNVGKLKTALALGAIKGNLYYWGVSADPSVWEAEEEVILRIWRSFQVLR